MSKIVVVGGHSRNIGKTSVVAGIIAGLREIEWSAFKITQFGHGECAVNGAACKCATDDHRFVIQEERDRSGKTDSSRFLVAGARKSFWVRTKQGMLFEAMPDLRRLLERSSFSVIESNSIRRFLQPDLYLQVLDYGVADFKESARYFMDLADAFILVESEAEQPKWENVSLKPAAGKPVFNVKPGSYVSEELLEFIKAGIRR